MKIDLCPKESWLLYIIRYCSDSGAGFRVGIMGLRRCHTVLQRARSMLWNSIFLVRVSWKICHDSFCDVD